MKPAIVTGWMLVGLEACSTPSVAYVRSRPSAPRSAAPAAVLEPTLLSAHFAVNNAPNLGGLDGITLVFSVEVDPASLQASAFRVVLADGRQVVPRGAILAPASERDENRTVSLLGEFGEPGASEPADVVVSGALYGETGPSLNGIAAPVSSYGQGGRIVFAQVRAEPCRSGARRLRTYWTDGLRGVATEDLDGLTVEFADGQAAHPIAFEDHRLGGEDNEDNVLDLCVDAGGRVVGVRVEDGVFSDVAGHPNAATNTEVARPRAAE